MKKSIALDIGERRIGVAVSDGLGMLAHPLTTLQWLDIEKLIDDVKKLIRENNAETLVIGVPFTLKGTESAKTKEILEIADQLAAAIDIDLVKTDERLTTKMAHDALKTVGKKPSRERNKIDQIAAVYILQSYLDNKKSL